MMVTGDQASTATAIGKMVNIIPENIKTPEEIVEEYQKRGEFYDLEEGINKSQCIVIDGNMINKYV